MEECEGKRKRFIAVIGHGLKRNDSNHNRKVIDA